MLAEYKLTDGTKIVFDFEAKHIVLPIEEKRRFHPHISGTQQKSFHLTKPYIKFFYGGNYLDYFKIDMTLEQFLETLGINYRKTT